MAVVSTGAGSGYARRVDGDAEAGGVAGLWAAHCADLYLQ